MPTLINTERTGSGETQYFDDGTSKFIQRPVGFFGDETPETPATIDRTTVTRDVPDVLSPTDFAASEKTKAETIRQEQADVARKRVAGIEQRFEGIVSQEETAGEGRLGSTRARGARGGLLGSSFGASQKAGTEEFNLQQQQFIQQQQEQEILAVYDLFDERASKRIEEERALSFATREEKIANRDAMIADSRTDFSMLGQSGQFPTLDLLSEEDIAEWSAQTGYSKEMLKLINSENQPAETKIDWQEEIIGNTYLRTGYNPVTGKMEVIKIDLPADSDGLQIIDGVPYNKVLNEDGTITLRKAEGFEEEQPSELEMYEAKKQIDAKYRVSSENISNVANISNADKIAIKNALLEQVGGDGYVSPNDYASAKEDWVSRGGTQASFDKEFDDRRNPANDGYNVAGKELDPPVYSKEWFNKVADVGYNSGLTTDDIYNRMIEKYSEEEIFNKAKEAGYASAWSGKEKDIKRYIESFRN